MITYRISWEQEERDFQACKNEGKEKKKVRSCQIYIEIKFLGKNNDIKER